MKTADQEPADREQLRSLIDRLHETYNELQGLLGDTTDTVIHNPSGSTYVLPGAQSALQDLERQARAFALERSAILDALPAQIALVDNAGSILAINQDWQDSAVSILGDASPSYIGDNYLRICDDAVGEGAEGAHEVAAGLRAVLSGSVNRFNYEYPCHAPDARRWFLVTITPLEPIATTGAVVMHFDITPRVLAQERADQWRKRLGSVINEAQIGILVHRGFKPLLANRECARLFGYSSADDILAVSDCSGLFPMARQSGDAGAGAVGTGESVEVMTLQTRSEASAGDTAQSPRLVERRSFYIPWDAELAQVEMLTDVTQQRAIEARLRQAQKMEAVGQLTGGVAHDFNNLLTVILGNAELLEEGLKGSPDLAAQAALIAKAANRGSQLTNRLLSFSRQQPLHPAPLDVNRLIQGMRDMLSRALGEHIHVELRLDPDIPMALADSGSLEDAVLNLCLNARDAMPGGGYLVLETRHLSVDCESGHRDQLHPGRYVVLGVSDTGCGMDAATLSRVFEPFFSTKDVGKGSGLGLSMVYGFIAQSGGHIKVSSEVSVGTRVLLYLPFADKGLVND